MFRPENKIGSGFGSISRVSGPGLNHLDSDGPDPIAIPSGERANQAISSWGDRISPNKPQFLYVLPKNLPQILWIHDLGPHTKLPQPKNPKSELPCSDSPKSTTKSCRSSSRARICPQIRALPPPNPQIRNSRAQNPPQIGDSASNFPQIRSPRAKIPQESELPHRKSPWIGTPEPPNPQIRSSRAQIYPKIGAHLKSPRKFPDRVSCARGPPQIEGRPPRRGPRRRAAPVWPPLPAPPRRGTSSTPPRSGPAPCVQAPASAPPSRSKQISRRRHATTDLGSTTHIGFGTPPPASPSGTSPAPRSSTVMPPAAAAMAAAARSAATMAASAATPWLGHPAPPLLQPPLHRRNPEAPRRFHLRHWGASFSAQASAPTSPPPRPPRPALEDCRFRAFVATFFTLMSSLMPCLGIAFCFLCMYCSFGLQIFGCIVYAGNPTLVETDLLSNDYLLFNFTDYPSGMVTLLNLLVMGNWQVWMESYKQLTGSYWSLAYFVSFYLISVLLLLNLIVAFVLEAFFTEMELEEAGEAGIQDSTLQGRNKTAIYAHEDQGQRTTVDISAAQLGHYRGYSNIILKLKYKVKKGVQLREACKLRSSEPGRRLRLVGRSEPKLVMTAVSWTTRYNRLML